MHKNAVSVRPEEGIESSGARVTGGCEPPDIGAQNRTRVHCKSSSILLTTVSRSSDSLGS